MTSEVKLVQLGEWDTKAKEQITGALASGLTAAGTTQADALPLAAGVALFTTVAANAGAVLKNEGAARTTVAVVTGATGPLKVYPPVGGYMNGVQNAAFSVAVSKTAQFVSPDGMNWVGLLSA